MIHQSDGTSYVVRDGYGNLPDNNGNWTLFCYFKYSAIPVGNANIISLFSAGPTFGDDYFVVHSDTNLSNIGLEGFSNPNFQTTTYHTVGDTNSHWIAVTYDSSTGISTLILDGSTVKTMTLSFATTTWQSIALLGSNGVQSPDVSVAYCRGWSRILNSSELTAESLAINAVSQTGLIWDCPLQASIDLTSHNNTLNQLAAVGTVTTDTTDPLISVIAGPPTNIDPSTATAITTDSAIFQNTLTSSTATTVWYKYTAVTGDNELGFCAFGDLVTYKPTTNPFDGLTAANAGTPVYLGTAGVNKPFQIPVTVGNTYYFRVLRNSTVTPATVSVSLLKALDLTVPVGSIAINDDTSGFPLVILDVNTGYPIKYIQDFPVSEGAGTLNTGVVLTADEDADDLKLFQSDFTTLSATVVLTGSDLARVSSNNTNKFLYGIQPGGSNQSVLRLISNLGVLDTTVFNLGANAGAWAIALNNNSTIGYYISLTANQPIKAWDLVNNVALSNLVAGFGANQTPGKDLLVMGNGSIIAIYFNSSTRDTNILAYSAAGATLHTYAFGVQGASTNGNDDRLMFAVDDPNSFWAWIRDTVTTSRFANIKYSDGSLLHNLTGIPQFEVGQYSPNASNTPVRFGHSESCPSWIIQSAISPVEPGSGLYKLTGTNIDNPRITHDSEWVDPSVGTTTNVAIPNPFAETYLVGDE